MTVDSKQSRPGESAISRWSRRKLEAENTPADSEIDTLVAPVDEAGEAQTPVLTDADMPELETLTEASDFSPFMSSGVSDELRNLALRKLFHAPVFNIRDGLDEYDEDYTSFEKLGDIVTADMKHQVEMQQQKLREALEQENATLDEAEFDEIEVIDDEDDTDLEERQQPLAADDIASNTESDS